jgi:hypothetical protein
LRWRYADVVHDLRFGEGDERAKAIGALVASGCGAVAILQALIRRRRP